MSATPLTLAFVPVGKVEAMIARMPTSYGEIYARYFQGYRGMWLAYVNYRMADGVEIHRPSPRFETDADAIAWIEAAIAHGPRFISPLLEDLS